MQKKKTIENVILQKIKDCLYNNTMLNLSIDDAKAIYSMCMELNNKIEKCVSKEELAFELSYETSVCVIDKIDLSDDDKIKEKIVDPFIQKILNTPYKCDFLFQVPIKLPTGINTIPISKDITLGKIEKLDQSAYKKFNGGSLASIATIIPYNIPSLQKDDIFIKINSDGYIYINNIESSIVFKDVYLKFKIFIYLSMFRVGIFKYNEWRSFQEPNLFLYHQHPDQG